MLAEVSLHPVSLTLVNMLIVKSRFFYYTSVSKLLIVKPHRVVVDRELRVSQVLKQLFLCLAIIRCYIVKVQGNRVNFIRPSHQYFLTLIYTVQGVPTLCSLYESKTIGSHRVKFGIIILSTLVNGHLSFIDHFKVLALLQVDIPYNMCWVVENLKSIVVENPKCNFKTQLLESNTLT